MLFTDGQDENPGFLLALHWALPLQHWHKWVSLIYWLQSFEDVLLSFLMDFLTEAPNGFVL